jgi:hypothetical protein
MEKTPEQLEWERAAKVGRSKSTKASLRIAASFLIAAVLGVGTLMVLLQLEEQAGIAREIARSEGVVFRRPRRTETGLHLILIPTGVGLVAFLGVFRLLGGRLSAEHLHGLRGGD